MKVLNVEDNVHRRAEVLKVQLRVTYSDLVSALMAVGRVHMDELKDAAYQASLRSYEKKRGVQ